MKIIDKRALLKFKLEQKNRIIRTAETVQNSNILLASYLKRKDARDVQLEMQKSSERTAPANASPSGPEAAQERK